MATRLKKGPVAVIFILLIILGGYYGYKRGLFEGWFQKEAKVDVTKPVSLPTAYTPEKEPVRVRVNIWVGCVGGLVANGGLETQPGSIYDQKGLKVEFKIIDDWTEGATSFANGKVDIMLTTVDVYAKDNYQFLRNGFGSHTILMVDWSRGADGIIAAQGINSIEDLRGKTIAFPEFTPSHFLLNNALTSSGLNKSERDGILGAAVHTRDGIESATLFGQGKVDAAVAWDPDMSDAVANRPGSKKIFDTKIASKLIADILIASDKFISQRPEAAVKFVEGWLQGVDFIKEQPSRSYAIVGAIRDFNIPEDLAKTMLDGVKLSDYYENKLFFQNGKSSDYANIFSLAQQSWREQLVIGKTVEDPSATADYRFVDALAKKYPGAAVAEVPEYHAPSKGAAPIMTQRKTIYFQVNSAEMSPDSRVVIREIAKFAQAYQNTYIEIAGNTDNTGSRDYNIKLSRDRAEVVKDFLISEFKFPGSRFSVKGKGPDNPIADNRTDEGRQLNRRTDILVYPNP
jgi:outer membrane protein OmpA-like peptidoglycan-associated protein